MRLEMREAAEPDFELLGLSVTALVVPTLAVWLVWVGGELPRNGLHDALDWTCVLCGGTRSLTHLFSGELGPAFQMNPLVAAGTLSLLVWCVYAAGTIAFSLRRLRVIFESLFERRLFGAGILLVLIANWSYVWLMEI